MKVYCNGDLIEKQRLGEIFEPGFLFGWGVFEPLRVYGQSIPFLGEHVQRLNGALSMLGLDAVTIGWEKTIKDVIAENNVKDAYVRITAYKKRKGTGLLIYADSFTYYEDAIYEKGFTALISPYKRNSAELASKVKGLSYLQNRLSWFEAQKKQKDEALVLDEQGYIVGGSRSNLFVVKDSCLISPQGAFSGITRKAVLAIAKEKGIVVKEAPLRVEDLTYCSEAFITSALMEIMPLVECEGKKIGNGSPGELTRAVHSEYRKLVCAYTFL